MPKHNFTKIDSKVVSQKGVQALADRPNNPSRIGEGGLSASQLKAWFDRLSDEIIKNIRDMQESINGENGISHIGMPKMLNIDADNLGDFLTALVTALRDGELSKELFVTYGNKLVSLQAAFFSAAQTISKNEEHVEKADTILARHNSEIYDLGRNVSYVAQELDNGKTYCFASHFSEEAEKARGYTKGGAIDRAFRSINQQIETLKDNGGSSGEDGKTPMFKLENGQLYVRYSDSEAWVSLGNVQGSNGEDGDDYILTVDDMNEIANLAAVKLMENAIIGTVDENNTIIVKGNLGNGSYSVKYEMEDGSTIDIGNLVVDAGAEPDAPTYTNLLPLAVDADGNDFVGENGEDGYKSGYKISVSTGGEKAIDDACITGFIPITSFNDVVRIKNVTLNNSDANINNIMFYDANKTKVTGSQGPLGSFPAIVTLEDGVYSFTPYSIVQSAIAFFRFSCGVITNETIVTINEEIV